MDAADAVPKGRVIARDSRVPASFVLDRSHHLWSALAGALGPPQGSELADGRYRADVGMYNMEKKELGAPERLCAVCFLHYRALNPDAEDLSGVENERFLSGVCSRRCWRLLSTVGAPAGEPPGQPVYAEAEWFGHGSASSTMSEGGGGTHIHHREDGSVVILDNETHASVMLDARGGVSSVRRIGGAESNACDFCARVGAPPVCTACKCARYCDARCQRAAWPGHRAHCKRIAASIAEAAGHHEEVVARRPPA